MCFHKSLLRLLVGSGALGLLVIMLASPAAFALTREEAAATILSLQEVGDDVTFMQISMPDTTHGGNVVAWDHTGTYSPFPMPYTNTWFAMVDQVPFAHWGHPALWVYLNDDNPSQYVTQARNVYALLADSGTKASLPLDCMAIPAYPELLPCDWGEIPEGSSVPPSAPPGQPLIPGAECIHACLFIANSNVGDLEKKDVARVKASLIAAGVPAGNISEDTDGTTETEIRSCITGKCPNLTARDNLIFFISAHGMPDYIDLETKAEANARGPDTPLPNDKLEASELKGMLESCNDICRVFVFLEACHSGSFIDDLDDLPNAIIVTAASADQESHGRSNGEGFHWAQCFGGQIPGISARAADENCDNEVTSNVQADWGEAGWGTPTQEPQYGASPGVQHEDDPIATCCETTTTEGSSWGAIKSLYR